MGWGWGWGWGWVLVLVLAGARPVAPLSQRWARPRHGALRKPRGDLTPGHCTWGPPMWWFIPDLVRPGNRSSNLLSALCPSCRWTNHNSGVGGG